MSIERVRAHFTALGIADRILEFSTSSATVELAAQALHTAPAHIAKTLSLRAGDRPLLVVTAGDAKLDNRRFKDHFGAKPRMLTAEEVVSVVGHAPGGVCPFVLPEGIPVYLDCSLQRFGIIYPACGSANSAIALSCEELARYAGAAGWVDVCKGWREEA